jgi:hypothetical protein
MRSTGYRDVGAGLLAVNPPPHLAAWVAVTEFGRQARLADVVVAVQGGEAQQAAGNADSGEAGVPSGRERPAVVHGRADHKPCRHSIVEQVNTAFRRMGLIFPLEPVQDL